jgi:DNA polymerase-3 subunit epsilon
MDRQIILDTETTGLEAAQGHRIIEIGCVELVNRRFTGNNYHRYLNPEREIDEGALAVHGISLDQLKDKPKFADIAEEFIQYIDGAELIIHNAAFDIGFLDAEFARLKKKRTKQMCPEVIDTWLMAKQLHPGKRNGLDALCDRYQIDNSTRTQHGALLDAELLADVYLAMTRGQNSLVIEVEAVPTKVQIVDEDISDVTLMVLPADEAEVAAHEAYLADLGKGAGDGLSMWKRVEGVQT